MKIGILGAGWFGLPLGQHFVNQGHQVKATTTSPDRIPQLRAAGIESFVLRFAPQAEGDLGFFRDLDLLVLNIPPQRRPDIEDFYMQQTQAVVRQLERAGVQKLVFISSTSVYPDLNRWVSEVDANVGGKTSGAALLQVEGYLRQLPTLRVSIVRFGGLMGPDREPGRFLAGRKGVAGGANPINMIHLDDCIGVVSSLIEQQAWGIVLNAVADKHPTKAEFYALAAQVGGYVPPQFTEEDAPFKIVANQVVKDMLGYQFRHPDPLQMLYQMAKPKQS